MWGVLYKLTINYTYLCTLISINQLSDNIQYSVSSKIEQNEKLNGDNLNYSDKEWNQLITEDSSDIEKDNTYLNILKSEKQKIIKFLVAKRMRETGQSLKQIKKTMKKEKKYFSICDKIKNEYEKIQISSKTTNSEKTIYPKYKNRLIDQKSNLKKSKSQFKNQELDENINEQLSNRNYKYLIYVVSYVYVIYLLVYLLFRTCCHIKIVNPLRIYVVITFFIGIIIFLF